MGARPCSLLCPWASAPVEGQGLRGARESRGGFQLTATPPMSYSSPGAQPRVFWSGHLTPGHEKRRRQWLSPVQEADADVKFSFPPFNNKCGLSFPAQVKRITAPAYGPSIANAVMSMFESEGMRSIAKRLSFTIPRHELSKLVQEKMFKVHDLIRHCDDTPDIAASSAAAVEKLRAFVEEFETLTESDIKDVYDWEGFVGRHVVAPGWQSKLHFDHLLGNFGFEKQVAETLRNTNFTNAKGEVDTFEQHALRWLGKAMAAYGPRGCLVDVVNLVFAMTGDTWEGLSDTEIAQKIEAFGARVVAARDTSGMWVPTHLFHDGETDDCLTWAVLEHVWNGQEHSVLIQLPEDADFDPLAETWASLPGCQVWRDPDSANMQALRDTHLKNHRPAEEPHHGMLHHATFPHDHKHHVTGYRRSALLRS